MNISIYQGDALHTLRSLEADSVDSVVTDPPYGLSKEPDIMEVLTNWMAQEDYVHRGGGFMGKSWDSFVPGPSIWREVYRVLKPGGHLLCFAGTRTSDLMGISLRMAGFEYRDTIMWIYGSGFPKSMNVSKAIDKSAGAVPVIVGDNPRAKQQTGQAGTVALSGDRQPNLHITAPATPDAEQWEGWGTALKPAHEPIILARKPLGEKTVAKNVLAHGTGALNIDGTRVVFQSEADHQAAFPGGALTSHGRGHLAGPADAQDIDRSSFGTERRTDGRWPANIILTHSPGCKPEGNEEVAEYDCESGCPVAEMDDQSGERKAGGKVKGHEPSRTGQNGIYGHWDRVENRPHNDKGGASRFFQTFEGVEVAIAEDPGFLYTAKAAKSERNKGLDALEDKPGTAPVGTGAKCRKCEKQKVNMPGSMCECDEPDWYTPVSNGVRKNHHPTVKPVKLMEYLCRLVTPPGGTVLDPFMGSGSTGVAAISEGFSFMGVEREPDYMPIAEARLLHAVKEADLDVEIQAQVVEPPAPESVDEPDVDVDPDPEPIPEPDPDPEPDPEPPVAVSPGALRNFD